MADIAIFRINYKSDFILTLNSDAGWLTPFCIKFWTGSPLQAYFVGYDGTDYTHCAPVEGEPTKLLVQFDDHHLPIGDLKFQIGYHFTVADFPTSVEDEVLNQASVIIEVDDAPAQVMLDLNGETAPEIQFTLPAYTNEQQRIANEEQRIAAETQRISNEEARIAAETVRQQNEQQRINQEQARVNEYAILKADAVAATDAANDAATQAQQKAEYAQQQGGYAKDQGDYAKNQGDYAKEQGDTALADHQRAEVDHGIAVDDHTQAGNDHTRAESDHGIAADDHTQAGNDHTRAESDHTRAESDHAAVEVYVDSLGAFDISAYHATGGVLANYADLTAALGTNGANIPEGIRKGGMSVKFVQSSGNKYVHYNLLAQSFTTDVEQWAIDDTGVYIDDSEWVKVVTDKDGRILAGIKTDGSIEWSVGVPTPVKEYVDGKLAELSLDEYDDIVAFLGNLIEGDTLATLLNAKANAAETTAALTLKANASDVNTALDGKVDKIAGKSLIDAEYATGIGYIEDTEGCVEIKVDPDDKIVSYRDKTGVLHENAGIESPEISTNSLVLTKAGMTDFQKALNDSGFALNDLSYKSQIVIPIPSSPAIVNIEAEQIYPYTEITGVMTFYDRNGNYFKKSIKGLSVQGQTTKVFIKKNIKFDFSNCEIKFGDWVMQDSFHLKAQYIDVFKGRSNIGYDYWREILEHKHIDSFTKPYINESDYSLYNGSGKFENNFSEARLTPAGFPIELYFNGDYYGLYTWNLKKDKANYAMNKTNTAHVLIDPVSIDDVINGYGIGWNYLELRNPKPKLSKDGWQVTDVDGNAYDGDNPKELIGEGNVGYDSSNVSHVKTNQIKQRINGLLNACTAVKNGQTKEVFETYFDPDWFADFVIFTNIFLDTDSIRRNTLYATYGGKWYVFPYDCDQTLGNTWKGTAINQGVSSTIMGSKYALYSVFMSLYRTEIEARYKVLRDDGIASTGHLISVISSYMKRIGKDAYKREFERWPNQPSYREPNDSPQWEFKGHIYEGDTVPELYDENTEYNVGDYVKIQTPDKSVYYYRCKESCVGILPYTEYFNDGTYVGGYFDSLTRTQKWFDARFEFLDTYFNYNNI